MDGWLEYVVRQIILYSLPVVVSLTVAGWGERLLTRAEPPANPFHALTAPTAWALPLAAIAVHQPVILALGRPVRPGARAAAARLCAHLMLCLAGFVLYGWALAHRPPAGLPPLHQWWAKVLMYFNLCVIMAHALPLPGLLSGEMVKRFLRLPDIRHLTLTALLLLSITPLLDLLIGRVLVYPVYEQLAAQASALFR